MKALIFLVMLAPSILALEKEFDIGTGEKITLRIGDDQDLEG